MMLYDVELQLKLSLIVGYVCLLTGGHKILKLSSAGFFQLLLNNISSTQCVELKVSNYMYSVTERIRLPRGHVTL